MTGTGSGTLFHQKEATNVRIHEAASEQDSSNEKRCHLRHVCQGDKVKADTRFETASHHAENSGVFQTKHPDVFKHLIYRRKNTDIRIKKATFVVLNKRAGAPASL